MHGAGLRPCDARGVNEPRYTQGRDWADVLLRILAGGVSAATGGWWLLCVSMVLSSRISAFGSDPHGYGLMFGTIMAVPVGFVLALTLPLTFPRGGRARVLSITMRSFLGVTALLFAALFTA